MKYPFEFASLLLGDTVFEKLGVKEWWGGSGDYCETNLRLNGLVMKVFMTDEVDGGDYYEPLYKPRMYTNDDYCYMRYLHELYDHIKSKGVPGAVEDFLGRCEKANMLGYINSYEDYLARQ